MEDLVKGSALSLAYGGKRVLVTGHTGFKGSWLCEWLLQLGADVCGLSLPPPTIPNLFGQLELERRLARHCVGDIRDFETVKKVIDEFAPDFLFHLAAQPIVRLSYRIPLETFHTNVLGSCHVLEAVRLCGRPCSVLMVTTDKCYLNSDGARLFSEMDQLGGCDPYSASKAAAEIAIGSYRDSFFSSPESCIAVASGRAGNVIGGGDWAEDRILPDMVRALQSDRPIPVRNPNAVRPWQHVLDPLSGYLALAARLQSESNLRGAFNFGPNESSHRSVRELVEAVFQWWPGSWSDQYSPVALHESTFLGLCTAKAQTALGWRPVWDFEQSIFQTVKWYREASDDARGLTSQQIVSYMKKASEDRLSWALPVD